MNHATLKRASRLIRAARAPLLVCHISPDGDAIGSMTGLGRALRQMELSPIMACADPIPAWFHYIPHAVEIAQEIRSPFDLVITLDCSDRERLGRIGQLETFDRAPLLNIDHHVTNLGFGDVNLVDPSAASTAEIVLKLLDALAASLDAEIATSLLTGVVTDTRGFRTSNVTPEVLEAALRLMRAGASLPEVVQRSLDRRPTAAILLWREALLSFQVQDRVAWAVISLAMRRSAGYVGNGDAGLVNFLISSADADIAAVFVEREEGYVEVGLRAAPGFDVARVALRFGGGGHTLAAGCRVAGSLDEVRERVLAALWEAARRPQRSGHG